MAIDRVLMLAHPGIDHLAYMMYDGLYKTLGSHNVIVYPFIRHYQGEVDDWFSLKDGTKGHTEPPPYVTHHDTPEMRLDEIAGNIDDFDIIYLSSARRYACSSLDKLIHLCGKENMPPIVFSDGEDTQSMSIVQMIKMVYKPAVCFKRELLTIDEEVRKDLSPLYPLPFSAVTDNMPVDNTEKDIDVFGLFGDTYPVRKDIVELLTKSDSLKKYNIMVGLEDHTEFTSSSKEKYKEFLGNMSRAKINIVARGWGFDTLRRFEAQCYSGMVMSDNIPISTPHPFKDGEHIVYFHNSLMGLTKLIDDFLTRDSDGRIRIGSAGKEHCFKYHTTKARAQYFLEKIKENPF